MQQIKGILFDKDGTLIDFDSLWQPVADAAVSALMERYGIGHPGASGVMERKRGPATTGIGEAADAPNEAASLAAACREEMLSAIGITDGRVDPDGILACDHAEDAGHALYRVLSGIVPDLEREEVVVETVRMLTDLAVECAPLIRPIGDLKALMTRLREEGLAIGMVTADTRASAEKFLEVFGLTAYFDYVGADDGTVRAKPHPEHMRRFSEKTGVPPESVAMVGDTLTDMRFGRNADAGKVIGVLSGAGEYGALKEMADIIVPHVGWLFNGPNPVWAPERAAEPMAQPA